MAATSVRAISVLGTPPPPPKHDEHENCERKASARGEGQKANHHRRSYLNQVRRLIEIELGLIRSCSVGWEAMKLGDEKDVLGFQEGDNVRKNLDVWPGGKA